MEQEPEKNTEEEDYLASLTPEEREEFRVMVDNTFRQVYSVQEAYRAAEDEKIIRDESFKMTKKNFKTVGQHVNASILKVQWLKLETAFAKLLTIILQNGRGPLVDEVMEQLLKAQHQLFDIRYLIRVLNKAFRFLKRHGVYACNYQFSELLQYIQNRELLMFSVLSDVMKKYELNVKGIQYIGTKDNQEALELVDNYIDNAVKALGLYKETPSDK